MTTLALRIIEQLKKHLRETLVLSGFPLKNKPTPAGSAVFYQQVAKQYLHERQTELGLYQTHAAQSEQWPALKAMIEEKLQTLDIAWLFNKPLDLLGRNALLCTAAQGDVDLLGQLLAALNESVDSSTGATVRGNHHDYILYTDYQGFNCLHWLHLSQTDDMKSFDQLQKFLSTQEAAEKRFKLLESLPNAFGQLPKSLKDYVNPISIRAPHALEHENCSNPLGQKDTLWQYAFTKDLNTQLIDEQDFLGNSWAHYFVLNTHFSADTVEKAGLTAVLKSPKMWQPNHLGVLPIHVALFMNHSQMYNQLRKQAQFFAADIQKSLKMDDIFWHYCDRCDNQAAADQKLLEALKTVSLYDTKVVGGVEAAQIEALQRDLACGAVLEQTPYSTGQKQSFHLAHLEAAMAQEAWHAAWKFWADTQSNDQVLTEQAYSLIKNFWPEHRTKALLSGLNSVASVYYPQAPVQLSLDNITSFKASMETDTQKVTAPLQDSLNSLTPEEAVRLLTQGNCHGLNSLLQFQDSETPSTWLSDWVQGTTGSRQFKLKLEKKNKECQGFWLELGRLERAQSAKNLLETLYAESFETENLAILGLLEDIRIELTQTNADLQTDQYLDNLLGYLNGLHSKSWTEVLSQDAAPNPNWKSRLHFLLENNVSEQEYFSRHLLNWVTLKQWDAFVQDGSLSKEAILNFRQEYQLSSAQFCALLLDLPCELDVKLSLLEAEEWTAAWWKDYVLTPNPRFQLRAKYESFATQLRQQLGDVRFVPFSDYLLQASRLQLQKHVQSSQAATSSAQDLFKEMQTKNLLDWSFFCVELGLLPAEQAADWLNEWKNKSELFADKSKLGHFLRCAELIKKPAVDSLDLFTLDFLQTVVSHPRLPNSPIQKLFEAEAFLPRFTEFLFALFDEPASQKKFTFFLAAVLSLMLNSGASMERVQEKLSRPVDQSLWNYFGTDRKLKSFWIYLQAAVEPITSYGAMQSFVIFALVKLIRDKKHSIAVGLLKLYLNTFPQTLREFEHLTAFSYPLVSSVLSTHFVGDEHNNVYSATDKKESRASLLEMYADFPVLWLAAEPKDNETQQMQAIQAIFAALIPLSFEATAADDVLPTQVAQANALKKVKNALEKQFLDRSVTQWLPTEVRCLDQGFLRFYNNFFKDLDSSDFTQDIFGEFKCKTVIDIVRAIQDVVKDNTHSQNKTEYQKKLFWHLAWLYFNLSDSQSADTISPEIIQDFLTIVKTMMSNFLKQDACIESVDAEQGNTLVPLDGDFSKMSVASKALIYWARASMERLFKKCQEPNVSNLPAVTQLNKMCLEFLFLFKGEALSRWEEMYQKLGVESAGLIVLRQEIQQAYKAPSTFSWLVQSLSFGFVNALPPALKDYALGSLKDSFDVQDPQKYLLFCDRLVEFIPLMSRLPVKDFLEHASLLWTIVIGADNPERVLQNLQRAYLSGWLYRSQEGMDTIRALPARLEELAMALLLQCLFKQKDLALSLYPNCPETFAKSYGYRRLLDNLQYMLAHVKGDQEGFHNLGRVTFFKAWHTLFKLVDMSQYSAMEILSVLLLTAKLAHPSQRDTLLRDYRDYASLEKMKEEMKGIFAPSQTGVTKAPASVVAPEDVFPFLTVLYQFMQVHKQRLTAQDELLLFIKTLLLSWCKANPSGVFSSGLNQIFSSLQDLKALKALYEYLGLQQPILKARETAADFWDTLLKQKSQGKPLLTTYLKRQIEELIAKNKGKEYCGPQALHSILGAEGLATLESYLVKQKPVVTPYLTASKTGELVRRPASPHKFR